MTIDRTSIVDLLTDDGLHNEFHDSAEAYAAADSVPRANHALTRHAHSLAEMVDRDIPVPDGALIIPPDIASTVQAARYDDA